MARQPRQFIPDYPHHLVVRGNNRVDIFRKSADRLFFLECLEHASVDYGLTVHAYVLMSNHVHLLATGREPDSAAQFFRSTGVRYVRYFNRENERTGTLWEGRFWSNIVQEDHYLLNCMRYIEMNPVRAGMVDRPGAFYWSSHACHAMGAGNDLVKPHPTYLALGETEDRRRQAYRGIFEPAEEHKVLDERFRQSIRRGWAVGDDEFVRWAESLLPTR